MLVISLGGSMIVPDKVDYKFLAKFKKIILKHVKKEKVVIITGGGGTFRNYMRSLKKVDIDDKTLGLIGIATTKLNARVVAGLFKTKDIPNSLNDVKKDIGKNKIVICGALGFKQGTTTDGNAAEIARHLKAKRIVNITNVAGLYDKDPRKHKNAKLINKISFKDFHDIASKIKYKAGQHFVLDQKAARIIRRHKIKTIILNGKNIKNVENFLNDKKFVGTIIG